MSLAPQAHAEFVFDITQSGSDIVATGSGSIDTAALSRQGGGNFAGMIEPSFAVLSLGGEAEVTDWGTIEGPSNFGGGTVLYASSSSGDLVGLFGGSSGELLLPSSYVSGAALSDFATWTGETLNSLV